MGRWREEVRQRGRKEGKDTDIEKELKGEVDKRGQMNIGKVKEKGDKGKEGEREWKKERREVGKSIVHAR